MYDFTLPATCPGYTAAAALRCLVKNGEAVPFVLDESLHPLAHPMHGCPFDELLDYGAVCRRFQFCLVDQALELLETLPEKHRLIRYLLGRVFQFSLTHYELSM